MITKNKMDFPCVWEKEWEAPWRNSELSYSGVPSSFIIDPQGTVMRNIYAGEGIGPKLNCLINNAKLIPPVKLQWSYLGRRAGNAEFKLQVVNPDRTPLAVHLWAKKLVYLYGEEVEGKWQEIKPVPKGKHPNANSLRSIAGYPDQVRQLTFAQSATSEIQLSIPLELDAYDIDAGAKILIPGTEDFAPSRPGADINKGIWLSEIERVAIQQPDWL